MDREKKPKHFLHQPEYPGGPKAMTEFIYQNLRYPETALKAGVEGTVYAEISINHRGEVFETRLLQGLGHGCDEEAVRVLMLLKFEIAKNRGVKVTFFKKVRVVFKKPKPVKQADVQVQYTVTPTEGKAEAKPQQEQTYSYTITIG